MSVQSREYEEVNATELQSKFHVEHLLGKGAFARVFKAHSLTRPRSNAALKIINIHKVAEQRRNQRRLMASHNSRKCGACSMYSISREENTEELFFPSRADKRARNDSNAQNEIDSEINSVKEMVKREVKVHREASKTRHPHIATLLDSFCYDLPRKIQAAVLVMEFCPLGDLHTYLVKRRRAERDAERGALLPENEARHALRHILRGLSFLHSIGIAHRDIKAGNILLSPMPNQMNEKDREFSLLHCILKIGDFGLAVKMSDEDDWDIAQQTFCGTPSCLAPEIIIGSSKSDAIVLENFVDANGNTKAVDENVGYGLPADLWSTGCLLYGKISEVGLEIHIFTMLMLAWVIVMLCGRYPFSHPPGCGGERRSEGNVVQKTLGRVVHGQWSIPNGIEIGLHAMSLLKQLLSLNPQERGFARGLVSTHLFFVVPNLVNVERTRQRNTIVLYGTSKKGRSVLQRDLVSSPQSQSHLKPIHPKRPSFVNPILGIGIFFPGKYQWVEILSGTQVLFTAFLLPCQLGVVMQCERIETSRKEAGVWIHLLETGKEICVGKLAPQQTLHKPLNVFNRFKIANAATASLVNEAFQRRPRQIWNMTNSHQNDVYSSTNTMLPSSQTHATLHSIPTAQSMPQINNWRKQYKPLSSILIAKNRIYFAIYKKLEKFLERNEIFLQSQIEMSVHHMADGSKTNQGLSLDNKLCSVTTIRDYKTRYILVTFKDAIQLKYSPSAEVGHLVNPADPDNIIVNVEFCGKLQRLIALDTDCAGLYSFHLRFAHEAIAKLLEVCRTNFLKPYNVPVIVEARGQSYKDWRLITQRFER